MHGTHTSERNFAFHMLLQSCISNHFDFDCLSQLLKVFNAGNCDAGNSHCVQSAALFLLPINILWWSAMYGALQRTCAVPIKQQIVKKYDNTLTIALLRSHRMPIKFVIFKVIVLLFDRIVRTIPENDFK